LPVYREITRNISQSCKVHVKKTSKDLCLCIFNNWFMQAHTSRDIRHKENLQTSLILQKKSNELLLWTVQISHVCPYPTRETGQIPRLRNTQECSQDQLKREWHVFCPANYKGPLKWNYNSPAWHLKRKAEQLLF
jgi:hypothetical protein